MKRRDFLTYSLLTGGSSLLLPLVTACQKGNKISSSMPIEGGAKVEEMKADIVVVGGGMGGCATALAACRNGMNVILTEETDWIGMITGLGCTIAGWGDGFRGIHCRNVIILYRLTVIVPEIPLNSWTSRECG